MVGPGLTENFLFFGHFWTICKNTKQKKIFAKICSLRKSNAGHGPNFFGSHPTGTAKDPYKCDTITISNWVPKSIINRRKCLLQINKYLSIVCISSNLAKYTSKIILKIMEEDSIFPDHVMSGTHEKSVSFDIFDRFGLTRKGVILIGNELS